MLSPFLCGPSGWECSQTTWERRSEPRSHWRLQTCGRRCWKRTERQRQFEHSAAQQRWPPQVRDAFGRVRLTSLHPRMGNSLEVRMSSMSRFMSRSLSEKPTRTKRPVGCRATLKASSWNSLYCSSVLVLVWSTNRGKVKGLYRILNICCNQ